MPHDTRRSRCLVCLGTLRERIAEHQCCESQERMAVV